MKTTEMFPCSKCDASFDRKASLGSHVFRVHTSRGRKLTKEMGRKGGTAKKRNRDALAFGGEALRNHVVKTFLPQPVLSVDEEQLDEINFCPGCAFDLRKIRHSVVNYCPSCACNIKALR